MGDAHRVLIVDPRGACRPQAPTDASIVTETVASVTEAVQRLRSAGYDAVLLKMDTPLEASLMLRIKKAQPNVRVITVGRRDPVLDRCKAVVQESRELVDSLKSLQDHHAETKRSAYRLAGIPIDDLVPFLLQQGDPAATLFRGAFERLGVALTHPVAATSGEARERLDRRGISTPTLVLLDLDLPEDSSFGFLSWMRGHRILSGVPVFVVSSSLDPRRRKSAFQLGANVFFSKPTFPGEHFHLVRTAIGLWDSHLKGKLLPEIEAIPEAPGWLRASS